jgi:hypothetical protein
MSSQDESVHGPIVMGSLVRAGMFVACSTLITSLRVLDNPRARRHHAAESGSARDSGARALP